VFAYLDCFSGVSGDKFLGALLSAGLSPDVLRDRLAELGLPGWSLRVEQVTRGGLAGTRVTVDVDSGQPQRDWAAIRALIEGAALDPAIRDGALRAFGLLAEAEAEAHGVPVDTVHFHEVGAVDSIVDIVGVAVGVHELGVDDVWASHVRVGHGTVDTSHGVLPVPAPATALLLRGVPTYAGDAEGEMTTPTGASLLRAFVTRYAPMPPSRTVAEGWGAGTREVHGVPNLLRLTLSARELGGAELEEVAVLESAIDHVTPELLAAALDMLLEEGALDAWASPIQMKKRRLGSEVTVLARPQDAERLTRALIMQTGTLGVRRRLQWRHVAPRRSETVTTSLGIVRVKVTGHGDALCVRPENDDVVAIARSTGIPLESVARRLTQETETAIRAQEDDTPR
jgi:uncharacterized protein (TIGR00299 family) protein